jgi:adenosylcobyric acid synthase
VILVADIDRGGVFAQIAGTMDLLQPHERPLIRGIIINRFRGDRSILEPGIEFIEKRTGVPVIGVLPWLSDLNLPAEDSMALPPAARGTTHHLPEACIRVGVVRLPRISNFTDIDPLALEPDCHVTYLDTPEQLAGIDLLILPGTKSTIPDLIHLKERGFFEAIAGFSGHIAGICGGFQMLGRRVLDPDGVESALAEAPGLGLLPVETRMLGDKTTRQATAQLAQAGQELAAGSDALVTGYEIHMGETSHRGAPRPFARICRRGAAEVMAEDGSVSGDGRVFGTYLHGIFDNTSFRTAYLNRIRKEKGLPLRIGHDRAGDAPFDRLADHLERHLDMARLLDICGLSR